MTPTEIEELKKLRDFDNKLAKALIPKGHRSFNFVDHPIIAEQLALQIRRTVDGHLTMFISEGFGRVPRKILGMPVYRRGNFKLHPYVGREIRTLVRAYFDAKGWSVRPTAKSDLRKASRQTLALVAAIAQRTPIARHL